VTTSKIQFVYDAQGRLLGEYNSVGGATQETIWFNGQPVATRINGVLYYISADHLGTPRSIVRASDNVELWRWDSDPFGTTAPIAPNPTAGSVKYNLRFPGQYADVETGLHYNIMRDYDPRTGRYVQSRSHRLDWGHESIHLCGRQSRRICRSERSCAYSRRTL
jgi:RHS repeat-associated protein